MCFGAVVESPALAIVRHSMSPEAEHESQNFVAPTQTALRQPFYNHRGSTWRSTDPRSVSDRHDVRGVQRKPRDFENSVMTQDKGIR